MKKDAILDNLKGKARQGKARQGKARQGNLLPEFRL